MRTTRRTYAAAPLPPRSGDPADSTCSIDPGVPLDLRLTLGELAHGRDPTILWAQDGLAWASRTPDGPVTLELRWLDSRLEVAAWGAGSDFALDRLPDLLGLDDDPDALVTDHPRLREAIHRSPGLRLTRTWGVAERLLPLVLGQLVTGPEAGRAYNLLMDRFGEPAPGPHGLRLRPPARTLARLPWEQYVGLGGRRANARTLQAVFTVPRRLEEIMEMDGPAASARLRALPGIGPWTAGEVMVRTLGFPDAVPVGDFHLPNGVAWFFERVPRADDARMLELLEPYRGQRGRVVRLIEAFGESAPKRGPRHPIRRRG